MISREDYLLELQSYISKTDKEITMILQNLQWSEKMLLQNPNKITCSINSNHNILEQNKDLHETECNIKSLGYNKEDILLPDPLNFGDPGLVVIRKDEIKNVISGGIEKQTTSQRVTEREPLTFERLQCQYTSDERRVAYDLAVAAAPACHDLSDLALLDSKGEKGSIARPKSRMEVLAELRDMKRRRMRYRAPVHTTKYSDVLRGLIATQMELYNETVKVKKEPEFNNLIEKNMKYAYQDEGEFQKETSKFGNSSNSSQAMKHDKYKKHNNVNNNDFKCHKMHYENKTSDIRYVHKDFRDQNNHRNKYKEYKPKNNKEETPTSGLDVNEGFKKHTDSKKNLIPHESDCTRKYKEHKKFRNKDTESSRDKYDSHYNYGPEIYTKKHQRSEEYVSRKRKEKYECSDSSKKKKI